MVIATQILNFDDYNDESFVMIIDIMALMDVSTNFFCILLSNQFAQKYYILFCGFMDNFCRKICIKCASNTSDKVHETVVISQLAKYVEKTETETKTIK